MQKETGKTATTLDEFCRICGRVNFGSVVRLGFGHWRHDACAMGSTEWKEYFFRQSPEKKKYLQTFFDFYYPDAQHITQEGGMHT